MRKDKILDHDLMPLERIMVWTNRTKMFHVIRYEWLSARRNDVTRSQSGKQGSFGTA
jgi:hypothetical protein